MSDSLLELEGPITVLGHVLVVVLMFGLECQ